MKKIVLICFLQSIAAVCFAQSSLQEGLLLHYPFNGNLLDTSGNGNNASGLVSYSNDHLGISNHAIDFSSNIQFATLPSISTLKPQLPVSFAFWVKFNSLNVSESWVFSTNYTEDRYLGLNANTNGNGQISFSFGDGDIGQTSPESRRSKTGSSSLAINTWYHIIGVIRGATDMDIYVDCINDNGTYSGSGDALSYDSNPGVLGRGDVLNFEPYFLNGHLDDFRFWERALDAQDIDQLCSEIMNIPIVYKSPNPFRIFPNPALNTINIESTSNLISNSIQFELTDFSGKVIIPDTPIVSSNSNFQIDISHLSNGVFFLSVKDQRDVFTYKFIK